LYEFARVEGRAVVASFDGGTITTDAGGLLLGATDRAIKLVDRFASCFRDARSPDRVEHEVKTLVGQRVFGIALGYEDLNDHDTLRHDPIMAVLAGKLQARRKDCAPVAGKSTLNRLELSRAEPTRYHKISHDEAAIERLFVDVFQDAHDKAPRQIILDLDATDDPLHGHQEGRFFQGYYDCYCYLPLYIFCGRHLLAAKLRPSNIDAAAGATEEVARIVEQIRRRWPRVRILLRADSGFCREDLMAWCEANRVDYLFGLAGNTRLDAEISAELATARAESERTGKPARRFRDFTWSTRDSWSRSRRVVGKAEWTQGEANPGSSSPHFARVKPRPAIFMRKSIARGARWRTGSRNASSTYSPTEPRPTPYSPTNSGSGSPPWRMFCSRRCAGSGCATPSSRTQPAARSASSCSRSARSSPSACAGSRSQWPRAPLTSTSSGSPMPYSSTPPADETDTA